MILFNGQLLSAQHESSFTNRAFKFGDSLFETIRAVDGKPLFTDAHINRLTDSMKVLKMNIPDNMNVPWLEENIKNLLYSNEIYQGARIRLTVYRKEGGFYMPENNDVDIVIEAKPLDNNCYELNQQGLILDVFREFVKPVDRITKLKTGNCLHYILAGIHCREKGLDDCLLVNEKGSIVEATSSNVFMIKGRNVMTPSLEEGCVSGIMRRQLIPVLQQLDFTVIETSLRPDDLLKADEIFLTNVVCGVKWVQGYQSKRFYYKSAKMIIHELNKTVQTNS